MLLFNIMNTIYYFHYLLFYIYENQTHTFN